jgi:fucose permease
MNLNKKDSLYFMIFYWLLMLVGRILCTFLTGLYFSPEIMLTISLLSLILVDILWIIFVWYIGLTKLSVFLLVSLTGLSISSISPTLIGWIKQFLN